MKSKKGVTLIEVIVVLALAAIIGGIAVSTSLSSAGKGRAIACTDARSDFVRVLMTEAALNQNDATAKLNETSAPITVQAAASDAGYVFSALSGSTYSFGIEGGCTEGGKWTVNYDVSTGVFTITCSVHDNNSSPVRDMNKMNETMRTEGTTLHDLIFNLNKNYVVDSSAPSKDAGLDGTTKKIEDAVLADCQFDISKYSWKVYCWDKGDPVLYFTNDYDLSNLPQEVIDKVNSGEKVPVTTYAWRTDGYASGTVKCGVAYITKKTTSTGAVYYILANASGGSGISTGTWKDVTVDDLP